MGTAIRTRIVKIGNSQGVRIPKPLLEQSGIQTEVEIEVHNDHLIVRAAPKLRVGWDEAFATMAEQHNDVLLDEVNTNTWEESEWQW
ncbi:MAG: AbrB/MazE/SpoVT family DNA-binding domain-containing protein [Nostoc sp. ChiSLP02]|nr:AbrB/MazE/SpoVT family DNA-binding domain-containing protein [Nostoc sp. DedSLP05]MDZ8099664.1 AbrB/MazE/SpoVT family DNA-binding domain-containing protein [Nostoc sp. DedSLP01]MDZ8186079.1 AbrB/MazE/SpoVT family DNA-binding domain-containing protein [Nostoc sp. ChiSLP02]